MVGVEALKVFIQRVTQALAVTEVSVDVYLNEQQRQPLEVLPDKAFVLAPFIDPAGVGHQVLAS